MLPLTTTVIAPLSNGQMTHTMKIQNSMVGQKGIIVKLKVLYNLFENKISQEATVSNFP